VITEAQDIKATEKRTTKSFPQENPESTTHRHIHSAFIDGKRVSRHAMKDCTTFLKLQEAALSKQTKAKRQGYEGNNKPPTSQQGNNGAPQGQDQPSQRCDDDGGYIPSKGHIMTMIQPIPKSKKEEKNIIR
jgi:hypothetical protein